ncbi:MAG: hypothetical protein AAFX06_07860 [Planctomycetota bacterium]
MSSKSQSFPNGPESVETIEGLDWADLTIRLDEQPLTEFDRWLDEDLHLLERELERFASRNSRKHGRG